MKRLLLRVVSVAASAILDLLSIAVLMLALALAYAEVVGPTEPPHDPDAPTTSACPQGRVIVRIFGTGSTGEFEPTLPGVADIDPQHPPQDIIAKRNTGFDHLLSGLHGCTIRTYSYDDTYLALEGPAPRGVNAWNDQESPWNRTPDVLAGYLQNLLDDELRGHPEKSVVIIGYSAGGIVPTYWAARATPDQLSQVRAIIAVDGVVSGYALLDAKKCLGNWRQIEIFPFKRLGHVPCQFAGNSEYVRAVTTTPWTQGIPFATIRANGDLVVPYEVAGLWNAVLVDDPNIDLPCDLGERSGGIWCLNPIATHGFILYNACSADQLAQIVTKPKEAAIEPCSKR